MKKKIGKRAILRAADKARGRVSKYSKARRAKLERDARARVNGFDDVFVMTAIIATL